MAVNELIKSSLNTYDTARQPADVYNMQNLDYALLDYLEGRCLSRQGSTVDCTISISVVSYLALQGEIRPL